MSVLFGHGSLPGFLLGLQPADNDSTGGVAHDVDGGTAHIKQTVDAVDEQNTLDGPTLVSTIASITTPAPETPAVPMEARVAVTTTITSCPMVSSMP